ncbi:hypothetical protein [Blastococcus aggregatus]|uniref:hypothetical protein n=1 Tax=Blastococcus aggregatus TaxID=38502 RepID=UPI000BE23FF1|nr:hypothetical protein [Blastococcus aggregatus]
MTVPTERATPACVAPGCAHGQARGLLCPAHHDKLGQTLADLAGDLTAGSEPSMTAWRTGGGSGGTLASERDPIDFRLLDAQTQAPPVLAASAGWLAQQRGVDHRPGQPDGDRKLLAHPGTSRGWSGSPRSPSSGARSAACGRRCARTCRCAAACAAVRCGSTAAAAGAPGAPRHGRAGRCFIWRRRNVRREPLRAMERPS